MAIDRVPSCDYSQYLKPELCISAGYCPQPSLAYAMGGGMRVV